MRTTDKYVFFWGGEFSNWYKCIFKYERITFFNSEQAFMWAKAMYFEDIDMAEKIIQTPDPKKNKALGRKVRNFDTDKWSEVSYDLMVDINLAKFSENSPRNKRCLNILLDTNDLTIVEASPYDKIWGIGLGVDDDRCEDESKWQGLNLLGKALMEVRDKLNDK